MVYSLPVYWYCYLLGSGYFASRGKIAPCYLAIWRQNNPNCYFGARIKIALSLILNQTQTLTLIPTLTLTQTNPNRGKTLFCL